MVRHCSGAHDERSLSHSVLSALACHLKGTIDDGVDIAGCSVLLRDCENRVSIIKFYEMTDELPDSVVIGRLAQYSRVISFPRDRENVHRPVFTGSSLHCRRVHSLLVSFATRDLSEVRR